MIYRPNKQQVEDYFSSPAMNQSRLKLLTKGVDYFNAVKEETESEVMFYEEKTHFILGHAAELKLQNGIEEFQNTYHMSDVKKPSDKLMSITQQIFDIQSRTKQPDEPFLLLTDNSLTDDIISAIEFHEYYPKWTREVKINRVKTDCNDYYNDLIKSYGKQILDLDEITIIDTIVNSLQGNNRTLHFFMGLPTEVDYIYQYPIYFTYQDMDFKVLIDILEVNHLNKTLKVIDIKTLGDYTIRFPSSMRKFRYDFQVAFYTIAVEQWRKNHPIVYNYKVINPAFIVETTKLGYQGNPLVFECSDQLIDIALYGRKLYSTSEHHDPEYVLTQQGRVKTSELYGVLDTINLYKWHLENGFEVDKIVRESDIKHTPLILDWEGIAE